MKSSTILFTCMTLLAACSKPEPKAPATSSDSSAAQRHSVLDARMDELAAADPSRAPLPPAADDADPGMVQGLLSTLVGPKSRFTEMAQQDLSGLGLSSLRPLLQTLESSQGEALQARRMRYQVASVLGALIHPRATAALLDLAGSDPDVDVRRMAIYQLGDLGSNPARPEGPYPDWVVPRLCLRLKYEKDPQCHLLLGQVLASHQNYSFLRAWFDLTRSDDVEQSTSAWTVLRELEAKTQLSAVELASSWSQGTSTPGPPPSNALRFEVWRWVSELSGEHFQLRGVDDARFALSDQGPWLAKELAPALVDQDLYVRLHVAQVFERMGPRAKAAVPDLIRALKSDLDLAPQAAASLAAIADPSAQGALRSAASAQNPLGLRIAAVRALGATAQPESAAVLESAILDGAQPGQEDLALNARAALLQVAPDPAEFDFLLALLAESAFNSGTAEVAFEALLQLRQNKQPADPDAPSPSDWLAWQALGKTFGAFPSAQGLKDRRRTRATWLSENRTRLLFE